MSKLLLLSSLIIILFTPCANADDLKLEDFKYNVKDDAYEVLKWSYQGAYKQFSGTQNLLLTGLAILSTSYFIKNDKEISDNVVKKHSNEKVLRFISDSSIIFNTPLIPLAFYGAGVVRKDKKMMSFAKEYMASMTLALFETGVISMIPVHQRPDQKELTVWETAFRGQSSFPSGHVVGYTILGFKAFQYYGVFAAAIPLGLAFATGFERVHAEKHFISDVVASGAISFLASEGVRYAANFDDNHPLYEWIFNHDFTINYTRNYGVPGMMMSFTY